MAIARTFPGVFIEEVPSGVRTITGVPTAIAAFVGRTRLGPVNQPVILNNFGEFESNFGGLDVNSSVSYSVRDFFLNGGGQAVVVRLYEPPTGTVANKATITFTQAVPLILDAANEGTWGRSLVVTIERLPPGDTLNEIAASLGVSANTVFTLRVVFGNTVEVHRHITLAPSSRRYDAVLATESRLVRARLPVRTDTNATNLPLVSTVDQTTGRDSAALTQTVPGSYFPTGNEVDKTGVRALERTDIFNILCIPPDTRDAVGWGETGPAVFAEALKYVVDRRAMLVIDPPSATAAGIGDQVRDFLADLALNGTFTRNAVVYFPRALEADPLRDGAVIAFAPCGIVAGVMARTDGTRGVWKAPAGIDASISGTRGLQVNMTDGDNGQINPIGVNALRTFPIVGSVVWGARTLRGADVLADEYKYLPVRRTALFIEESLFRGTKFAVFEPNDEPLWSQLRLNIGAFMNNLFRQGAFQGQTAREAYFVKCDKETTTQNDINLGVVNILVGFAPLKPAEFVVIKLQQIAGQIAT